MKKHNNHRKGGEDKHREYRDKHKFKARKRYREPAVVEAPKKVKIISLPFPKPKHVAEAQASIYRKILRNGTRKYRRHRDRADKAVKQVLRTYHIKGTSSELYWKLAFTCLLIGK